MKCLNCNCESMFKTKIGFTFEGGYPEGILMEEEIKIREKGWVYTNLNAYKCDNCGFVMLFSEKK